MAKLNFPDPSVTQIYTEAGITWTWNSTLNVWSSAIAEVERSSSVFVSSVPPAGAVKGDLWWNTSDDSGRLYVYYEDVNSNQWVEASPQGDTLTESEADGLYLSKVTNDTAAGEITFEGRTTHNGISLFNDITTHVGGVRISDEPLIVQAMTNGIQINSILNNNKTTEHVGFFANADTNYNNTKDNIGFKASSALSFTTTSDAKGFYSNLNNNGTAANTFNFYAAGDAPNYFQGNTYIGGSTARNTFELWKSTLTEEQQEELGAGTLVAPTNISQPGNGSFARQWYYDQQDAETQAELDAGTLDYPEHLAAATFTDTFDLGDNTNINLLSNGRGEFSGGVKVTGGTASAVSSGGSAGIYFNNSEDFVVALDNSNHTNYSLDLGVRVTNRIPDGKAVTAGFYSQSDFRSVTGIVNEHIGVKSSTTGASEKIVDYKGFVSDNVHNFVTNTTGAVGYGYYSDNQTSTSKPNAKVYNFYAAGNAPSFFQGLTEHAGGVQVTGGNRGKVINGLCQPSNNILDLVAAGEFVFRMAAGKSWCSVRGSRDLTGSRGYGIIGDAQNSGAKTGSSMVQFMSRGKTLEASEPKTVDSHFGFFASNTKDGDANYGFYSTLLSDSTGRDNYNFYAAGDAPNYFAGNITCDGLINGAFSLRMQSDEPTAFQTTYSTDEEGNQVENQEYIGTTEDLLTIIKDLRDRVAALEGA